MSEELIAAMSQLLTLDTARRLPKSATKTRKALNFEKLKPGDLQQSFEIATRASKMREAFQDWAEDQGLEGASFAVLRRGNVVAVTSYGNESARARNEFASCSKLVTGLAAAQLVRAGKLKWTTTMEEIFGRIFRIQLRHLREITQLREPQLVDIASRYKPLDATKVAKEKAFEFKAIVRPGRVTPRSLVVPVIVEFPEWFRKLTVTQVMTHTSGIRGDLGEGNPYDISIDDRFALIVFSKQEGTHFSYENNNTLVVGKIIEQITGKSYRDAVLDLVLKPLGISDFDADNRGPYAGCWLSTENYARMMRYLDRDLGLMGEAGPDSWPRASGYSIGTFMSAPSATYDTNHSGAWTWNGASLGAFQQYWHDVRTGYFVRYSPLGVDVGPLSQKLREIATDTSLPALDFTTLLDRLKKAGGST